MQVNPTITEAARRAQITEAAIAVIAEVGYAKASFARIVAAAGLSSTRLISYHFRGKGDLTMAVLITALGAADERLDALLAGVTDRAEMLDAYIRAQVDLYRTHPAHLRALGEIAAHAPEYAPVLRDFRVGRLERQLAQGQREGIFGAFDAPIMARAIARAVEGAAEDGTDTDAYGRELAATFARAVFSGGGAPPR